MIRPMVMELRRNLPYWLLVAGSLAWIGLTLLAPWARARGVVGASFLYAFFAPVCHQLPERSFACFGHPLAVCHRCFGLYTGFALGLLVLSSLHRLRERLLGQPRLILAFFAPMVADVLLGELNTGPSRLITGLVAAFPVGLFVWAALEQLYQKTLNRFRGANNGLQQTR